MNLYMITNLVTYLHLTLAQPTTLIFDAPIEYWSQSNDSSTTIYRSKNQRVLSLKANKENENSSLVVITKNAVYSYKIQSVLSQEPMVYTVKDASPSNTYFTIFKNSDYELLDGGEVYLLKVKKDKITKVNDLPAKDIMYLPKNSKIKINDEFLKL